MSTPDIPVEIWLEILEYLPRSALRKLMGVNRTLFELAFDDLYEEIRFVNDDKAMLKGFNQLKHQNIARRVRHLFIRPAFLPGVDEVISPTSTSSGFTYLKDLGKRPKSVIRGVDSAQHLWDPSYGILEVAKEAVKACTNVRHLTIVLHDHTLTPSFLTFLNSLWASDSVGPKLTKLSVDTTVVKLPLLLKPLMDRASSMTSLKELDISLAVSRFGHSASDWLRTWQSLANFVSAFSGTVSALTLSSAVVEDLQPLFSNFPKSSKLKKLSLFAIFNEKTLPNAQELTAFLSKMMPTLEHLVIKPRPQQESFHHTDEVYALWLNPDSMPSANQPRDSRNRWGFGELVFPKLKTLDVELRYIRHEWDKHPLPSLALTTPNLTTLILTGLDLSILRLAYIIEGLPQSGSLEMFEIDRDALCPHAFDLLSKQLPQLKALTIRYTRISPTSHRRFPTNKLESEFNDEMRARKYSASALRHLRLAKISACGEYHPTPLIMKVVAESFPNDIELDTAFHCSCITLDSE